jgi:hypothetical protein
MTIDPQRWEHLTPQQQAAVTAQQMVWTYDSETEWRSYVMEAARFAGWSVFYWPDSRRTTPGWPDIALLRVPDFLLVELKTNNGKLTRQQQLTISELQASGIHVEVWRPVDEAHVMRYLKRNSEGQ